MSLCCWQIQKEEAPFIVYSVKGEGELLRYLRAPPLESDYPPAERE